MNYLGLTLLFTIPPLCLLWLREEFVAVLKKHVKGILAATALLSVFGNVIWPLAMRWGAWAYAPEKLTGIRLFSLVWLEDVVWWVLVSFLFASFITLSRHYEKLGVDIVERELRALRNSFRDAFRGLKTVTKERNIGIHATVMVAVIVAGAFSSLTITEWAIITIGIALALCAEFINYALERHVDAVVQNHDENAGKAKDAAAAGVLIADIVALILAGLVFVPRIIPFIAFLQQFK